MSGANKQLVRSFFEALSSGDLERLWSFLDEESTWEVCAAEIAGAGLHRGREIVEEFLGPVRGWFEPGDPKVEIETMIAEGNLVAVEAEGRGRFLGGTEYHNRYSFVLEVRGDRIGAVREYMDTEYAHRIVAEAVPGAGS